MVSKQIYGFLRDAIFPGSDPSTDDAKMSTVSSRAELTPSRVRVGDLVYLKYRNPNKPYAVSTKEHLVIISATERMPSGYGVNLSTKNRLVAAYSVYPSSPETLRIILSAIYKNRSVKYGKGVMSNMFSTLFGPRRFKTFIQNKAFGVHKIDFRAVEDFSTITGD